jgi:hypothetical protein
MRSWRSNTVTLYDEENVLQGTSEMSDKLTEFEKEVYDFIKGRGEILTSNMPTRMNGAIPNLKKTGVIEVFKKSTSRWASKKRKFVRIRDSRNGS